MTSPKDLKERHFARLDDLIAAADAIPLERHSSQTSYSALTGESTYRHYDLAKWAEFVEWRSSCAVLLDQVVPRDSVLRESVELFPSLRNDASKLEYASALLKSVRRELADGSFDSLATRVEADVVADYLDQAVACLGEDRNDATVAAAAVLAGASLERGLRTLCLHLEPPEPIRKATGARLTLNGLIDSLKRRNAFNELQAKQLRAWAGLRNAAAHGDFSSFTRGQVDVMIQGVTNFLANHL